MSSAAAAVWGAARVLANERPEITVRRVRLVHTGEPAEVLAPLRRLLVAGTAEDELVITPHGRLVSRIGHLRLASASASGSYVLSSRVRGPNCELEWRQCDTLRPREGEMLVEARAAALNFRDVMTVMGHLPPFPPRNPAGGPIPLGHECAGVVTALGPGVAGWSLGDRVMVPAVNSLASHVLAVAERAIRLPDTMTFEEAATFPLVFLTAELALRHTARLGAGETVLVHGASGGVGLAALQCAADLGATMIATAGTPAKREFLHSLGVEHVFDSRSVAFVEDVRRCTGGAGMDVVLNSLAGDGLLGGLELLKPHGRLVEIGKRDILADSALPMAAFAKCATVASIDLHMALESPEHTRMIRASLEERVRSGRYRPLPYHLVAAREVRDGFTLLQRSRHIGKVVISFDEAPPALPARSAIRLRPDRTYLVTGGVGGIGAASAETLAEHGARHLALVSRSGADAPDAATVSGRLIQRGVDVRVHAADVSDAAAMSAVLEEIRRDGFPLGGIVHAAMVLDDAPLADLTHERLRAVLAPKAQGAEVLDVLARDLDLEFFVVWSSVAALIGNTAQAAYVGGNTAMESLVRDRRARGLPAQTIQLGPVSGTGFVERAQLADHLARSGMGRMTRPEAMAALTEALADPGLASFCAADADWTEMALNLPALGSPRTSEVMDPKRTSTVAQARESLAGLTPEKAKAKVRDVLVELLAGVMHASPDQVDTTRSLDQLGVESLMASELAALIRNRLDCVVPVLELTGAASVQALAARIHSRIRVPDNGSPATGR